MVHDSSPLPPVIQEEPGSLFPVTPVMWVRSLPTERSLAGLHRSVDDTPLKQHNCSHVVTATGRGEGRGGGDRAKGSLS